MKRTSAGFALIELLFAGAMFVVFSAGLVTLLLQAIDQDRRSTELVEALGYAREGIETVRAMRRENFLEVGTVNQGGVESMSGNKFRFTGSSNTSDKYERQITVEMANRSGGSIVSGGGSSDDRTMKVTAMVQWESTLGQPQSIELVEYLTYWNEPL